VADRVAEAGYIALAPEFLADTLDLEALRPMQGDLFDPEKRNAVQPKLRQLMTPMHNPEFGKKTIERLQSCFDYLYAMPEVKEKVAVMGFCFGGTYSFNLASIESKLKVSIPFYGHAEQDVQTLAQIKCPVRAFYGENDERLIEDLPGLTERMNEAGVDFSSKVYEDCGHAFFNDTNKFAYNKAAATDAWQMVQSILDQYMV
jgi:carboxymethylenebutenolidase